MVNIKNNDQFKTGDLVKYKTMDDCLCLGIIFKKERITYDEKVGFTVHWLVVKSSYYFDKHLNIGAFLSPMSMTELKKYE